MRWLNRANHKQRDGLKRYRILAAAIVMQMCLGATYAWSVFVLPPKQTTGILQGTAQLPFSLFYFAFPATMIITGTLLPRIGPRRCAVIGGLLFGAGWLLASLGRYDFGFTVLGSFSLVFWGDWWHDDLWRPGFGAEWANSIGMSIISLQIKLLGASKPPSIYSCQFCINVI